MTDYCRECWCDHSATDCTHYAVEQVDGRWLCQFHADLVKARQQTPSIVCPQCGRRSYNPNDVRERYCGNCHDYIDLSKGAYYCPQGDGVVFEFGHGRLDNAGVALAKVHQHLQDVHGIDEWAARRGRWWRR